MPPKITSPPLPKITSRVTRATKKLPISTPIWRIPTKKSSLETRIANAKDSAAFLLAQTIKKSELLKLSALTAAKNKEDQRLLEENQRLLDEEEAIALDALEFKQDFNRKVIQVFLFLHSLHNLISPLLLIFASGNIQFSRHERRR